MGNLQSAIDELAAEDLTRVPATRIADDALEQFRESERLHAQALRRLVVVDASGVWAEDGSLSSKAWLRRHGRMTAGAAAERVRFARRLDDQPRVREAFEAGDISYDNVRHISRTLADTNDRLEVDKRDEAEAMLVEGPGTTIPTRCARCASTSATWSTPRVSVSRRPSVTTGGGSTCRR